MEFLNQTIGKYQLSRVIGQGGMACVYEGVHVKLGNKVAVKVLNPILARNTQIRERFENEANFMVSLSHPNITKVLDFEDHGDVVAIVMELLKGEELDQYVKSKKGLPETEVKDIFKQICSAFSYAHDKGIVHRDIKPSNIFIEPNGMIKVLDFGIAKVFGTGNDMTQTGTQMGTPIYMSPEQVRGEKSIDHRSDIYALGMNLYFMLNGKTPYNTDEISQFDLFNKIVNEDIPELDKFPAWNDIIQIALKKNRTDRYQKVDDFSIAVQSIEFGVSQVKPKREKVKVKESNLASKPFRVFFGVISAILVFICLPLSFDEPYQLLGIFLTALSLLIAVLANGLRKSRKFHGKWLTVLAIWMSIGILSAHLLFAFYYNAKGGNLRKYYHLDLYKKELKKIIK